MAKICEISGVELDEKFNVQGQYYSNPYVIKYMLDTLLFVSDKTGEDIASWIMIKLIEGDLKIEKLK